MRRLTRFRVPRHVDAVDDGATRRRRRAGRTACGSSWTCRRRCCRGSRTPRPVPRRNSRRRTATKRPKWRVSRSTWIATAASSAITDLRPRAAGAPRRAGARPTTASAPVRPASSATCASSTSVLVATPASNRSPTTRRASVAAATASVRRRERGPRGPHVEQALAHFDGDARRRNRRGAAVRRRPAPTAAAWSARARPPSNSGHVTFTPTSHDVFHVSVARHESRIGPRRLDRGDGGDLRPRAGDGGRGARVERRLPGFERGTLRPRRARPLHERLKGKVREHRRRRPAAAPAPRSARCSGPPARRSGAPGPPGRRLRRSGPG